MCLDQTARCFCPSQQSPCQIKHSQWEKFLPGLGRETANTTSMTLTNHCYRGDGTRKMPEGALTMFTYELRQPVILLVNTTVHILGDMTHSRKIQKNSNMLDFWWGRWGASQIAVRHLCLATRLLLVPDANNWSRRWEFVSHDQNC